MADISKIVPLNGITYNIKDASARTSLNSIAVASTYVTAANVEMDNISLASGANTYTISAEKSGYTPVAIVGLRILNATTSGTGSSRALVTRFELSGTNVIVTVRNMNSGTMVFKIIVRVLYRLN